MKVKPARSRLAPVAVTYHVRECEWELIERVCIYDPTKHAVIDVPQGFRFDLASIPRPLWWLVAPMELSVVAALTHDWLYRNGGRCVWNATEGPEVAQYTRKEADEAFRLFMKSEGVPVWRREAAYRAVRWFGRHAWQG